VFRYIIESQSYPSGPWQFKAQFGEKEAHDSSVAGIIGTHDEYESVTVSRSIWWSIIAIVRPDGSRERYKLKRESV